MSVSAFNAANTKDLEQLVTDFAQNTIYNIISQNNNITQAWI